MTTPLWCVLFFAAWTLSLVALGVGPWRVLQVLLHRARPNGFASGSPHGPDWYQRLNRAHANCVENLPVFGAVVLLGHVTGLTSGLFATLAQVYVAARVGQTLAHLSSGRSLVVNVRFTFFVVQVTVVGWMMVLIARSG